MAWITPVTNRVAGSRTTATDMNRIANNITEIVPILNKTEYTSSDIVSSDNWGEITWLPKVIDATITDSTDYVNFNKIEQAILNARERDFINFHLRDNGTDYLQFAYSGQSYSNWVTSRYNRGNIVPRTSDHTFATWDTSISSNSPVYFPKSMTKSQVKVAVDNAIAYANDNMPQGTLATITGCNFALIGTKWCVSQIVGKLAKSTTIEDGDTIATDTAKTYLGTFISAFKTKATEQGASLGNDVRSSESTLLLYKV